MRSSRVEPNARARGASPGRAVLGGRRAAGVVDHVVLSEPGAHLDGGFWAVVGDFEGVVHAWRFAEVSPTAAEPGAGPRPAPAWRGPARDTWVSTLDRPEYLAGVEAVRAAVRDGDVYQVNLCRVLSAPLPGRPGAEPDAQALADGLAVGNPAPYAGWVHVPVASPEPGRPAEPVPGVWVVTASPELFLRVGEGLVTSGPIKGTAATADGLTTKDRAENVMIADMVRNDLQRVCGPGTVEVVDLLALEHHPGLVHLVTTVQGRLEHPQPDWSALLAATYPPASVSGAPKQSALGVIRRLEPEPRGPYCGAVGWIDADEGRAELAVGIRTFWWTPAEGGTLRFGTGAGITWASDPAAEWAETELKAARLVSLASDT
ncbi:chorismate-binding protein [Actinotalea sp. M2MS4P-6]|uniref:chorismate-binding protein n=1 Tax=Actinotalea sp. M2MS4P-6 TaxID=2983762 RepID=UPI0021E47BBD|nr:chorismate-binding protein [Actinotalea sp. M2MS4P-6]MCV2394516.1 chorismate-binding protein [Actinotalea sp. M2MS4P-6]